MEYPITILVIEDHDIVVWALRLLLQNHYPGAALCAASSLDQGLKILETTNVTLIILDVDVPGGNSTDMIQRIRASNANVRILIHTSMNEDEYALEYLTAGADGFVSKKSEFADVMPQAIDTVLNGKKYMSSSTQELIVRQYLDQIPLVKKPTIELSAREQEIVLLLLAGKWTKEIASQLGLGMTTISTHKQRIFDKFNVQNIVELYVKIQKEMPGFLRSSNIGMP